MNKIKLIPFLLIAVLYTCTDENEFEYPLIQTGNVTNIDSTGATFHARITNLGNSDILEYGFIWSEIPNDGFGSSEKFLVSGTPSANIISERISATLKENVVYYIRAFIKNRDVISYGKELAFKSLGSLAPVISDFSPKSGNIRDSLIIVGENFSYLIQNNLVSFGEFPANVIKAQPDTLIVLVPAELNTAEAKLSVYVAGNIIIANEPFKLNIPVIDDFYPKNSTFGSVIEISGNFIPDITKLDIEFDEIKAEIISSSEKLLRVRVPLELLVMECRIKLEMNNHTAISEEIFQLDLPEIHSFDPQSAAFHSEITLSGENLNCNEKYTRVFVGNYQAEILDMSEDRIRILLPDSLDERINQVYLDINGIKIFADKNLSIASLGLQVFSPDRVNTGSVITIYGDNFSPVAKNNIVLLGNVKAEILTATHNTLTIKIPHQNKAIYPEREITVSVEVLGETQQFFEPLFINDKWFRLENFPGGDSNEANYFVSENHVYVGLNHTKEFWRFDPLTHEWKRMRDFPGAERIFGTGFYLNGNIYFGSGCVAHYYTTNDFWQYEIAADTWIQKNNLPGIRSERFGASGFSVKDKGYITSGAWRCNNYIGLPDSWEYNPGTDEWSAIEHYVTDRTESFIRGTAIQVNGEVFYGLGLSAFNEVGPRVYRFNPEAGSKWERIPDFPEDLNQSRALAFELDGTPYFKTVLSDFYRYSKLTNEWVKVETDFPQHTDGAIGFSILNKAYIITGNSKTVWEYDPYR